MAEEMISIPGIFRAYDIRGTYPAEINEITASELGKAFGSIKQGKIAVTCDCRKSSPALKKAFMAGLFGTGATVVDCGTMSTPMMVFTVSRYGFDAGAVITASHNPPEHNGLKMYDRGGVPISWETGIGRMEKIVGSRRYKEGSGKMEKKDVVKDYVDFVAGSIQHGPRLKIVVDAMNGACSKVVPEVLRRIGLDVIELRCGFDGDFPAIGPDPSKPENLKLLQEEVLKEKADLGMAFDGDGDRLVAVDNEGRVIESRRLFGMLVKNAALSNPGFKAVHDSLTSEMVVNSIRESGGIPVICRVGHTYITQKMLEENASIAGELSGHYFFRETAGGDDALFAAVRLLEYIGSSGKALKELASEFPVFLQGDRRETIRPEAKLEFIEKLKERFSKAYTIDTLDGVKISDADGWVLFRAANTEAKISIAWEARNEAGFRRLEKLVEDVVKEIPR